MLRLVTVCRPAKAFNFYFGHPDVCTAIITDKDNRGQKQNLNNYLMGDFRHVGSELSRISREGKNIRRQRVPLNYSSKISGVGKRKLSPGFTATRLLNSKKVL